MQNNPPFEKNNLKKMHMQHLKLNTDLKILMQEYDFKYFLDKHVQENQDKYSEDQFQAIYGAYKKQKF